MGVVVGAAIVGAIVSNVLTTGSQGGMQSAGGGGGGGGGGLMGFGGGGVSQPNIGHVSGQAIEDAGGDLSGGQGGGGVNAGWGAAAGAAAGNVLGTGSSGGSASFQNAQLSPMSSSVSQPSLGGFQNGGGGGIAAGPGLIGLGPSTMGQSTVGMPGVPGVGGSPQLNINAPRQGGSGAFIEGASAGPGGSVSSEPLPYNPANPLDVISAQNPGQFPAGGDVPPDVLPGIGQQGVFGSGQGNEIPAKADELALKDDVQAQLFGDSPGLDPDINPPIPGTQGTPQQDAIQRAIAAIADAFKPPQGTLLDPNDSLPLQIVKMIALASSIGGVGSNPFGANAVNDPAPMTGPEKAQAVKDSLILQQAVKSQKVVVNQMEPAKREGKINQWLDEISVSTGMPRDDAIMLAMESKLRSPFDSQDVAELVASDLPSAKPLKTQLENASSPEEWQDVLTSPEYFKWAEEASIKKQVEGGVEKRLIGFKKHFEKTGDLEKGERLTESKLTELDNMTGENAVPNEFRLGVPGVHAAVNDSGIGLRLDVESNADIERKVVAIEGDDAKRIGKKEDIAQGVAKGPKRMGPLKEHPQLGWGQMDLSTDEWISKARPSTGNAAADKRNNELDIKLAQNAGNIADLVTLRAQAAGMPHGSFGARGAVSMHLGGGVAMVFGTDYGESAVEMFTGGGDESDIKKYRLRAQKISAAAVPLVVREGGARVSDKELALTMDFVGAISSMTDQKQIDAGLLELQITQLLSDERVLAANGREPRFEVMTEAGRAKTTRDLRDLYGLYPTPKPGKPINMSKIKDFIDRRVFEVQMGPGAGPRDGGSWVTGLSQEQQEVLDSVVVE